MQSRWLIGRRGLPRCENQSILSEGDLDRKGCSREKERERELYARTRVILYSRQKREEEIKDLGSIQLHILDDESD